MKSKTLFAVIFGALLVATLFATQASAFFWLGGCSTSCMPTPTPPPVIDPNAVRIGSACGVMVSDGEVAVGDCIAHCNWRFSGDVASAQACRGAVPN